MKIRVGAVNYLNTKPLIYGIKKSELINEIELSEDYPAKIAVQLLNNQIDIGLVPVAIIPKLKESYIVCDYCIGATKAVASVCLFSDAPLHEIRKIILDYQSRTSVNLCKILLNKYWKLNIELIDGRENFIEDIKGTTAAVVIGDRAFELRKKYAFVYDLAEEWIKFTELPFVFAAWIANKKMPDSFVKKFNEANKFGLNHLNEVIAESNYQTYDLHHYYTQNLSYNFDDRKRNGLQLFLKLLKEISIE